MKIIISTFEEQAFVITPIDFSFKDVRGLKMYVKNLNGGYIADEKAIIPITGADLLELYHNTVKLFANRLGMEIQHDSEADNVLYKAKNEEERFDIFSKKALSIRNNEVDREELISFLEEIKGSNFHRTLKPFQLLSAYHLAFSQNACNFSVPGSGKTTTVLAAYSYLSNTSDLYKHVDKMLVVGPLSSFLAWKREFTYCFGREPDVLEITGATPTKVVNKTLINSEVDKDIILISYGSVSKYLEELSFFLRNNSVMVVLDEAHRIKNVDDGKQSTATLFLSPEAKSRVVLTGTPAPNGYVDLYNLYKFIWPSHNVIGYSIPQLANMSKHENDSRVEDLAKRIEPFFIRIKKSDLNLPDPVFNPPIQVPMSPAQERIYSAIAKMAVGRLENHSFSQGVRLSALIRMRQAATNPALLSQGLDCCFDVNDENSGSLELDNTLHVDDEIMYLIEQYEKIEVPNKFIKAKEVAECIIRRGEKLVIWCEFVGTCDGISCYFQNNGIQNRILYGKTPIEEREEIIKEFTDPDCKSSFDVIIANPHAVGESISLHTTCHNALYLEQGFNAGAYMQSKDRIHRVGLLPTDVTNYFYLHSSDTVDEAVFTRVNNKERRMIELIENQDIPLIVDNHDYLEDNEDDIKAVIRGYYEYRKKHI